MKKFLNFSTILFSYLLITVLVISCGGSSGGGGGTGGSSVGDATNGNGDNGGDATDSTDGSGGNGGEPNDATNGSDGNGGEPNDATNGSDGNGGEPTDGADGGGNLPQADLSDKTCLLSGREDKDAVAAVLCQGDSFIGLITKTTPAGQDAQQINFLIPSTANAGGTPSRTWDLSTGGQIQISYDKDYTLTVDEPAEGASQLGTLADAAEHTAEFPLKNLTIASLLNDSKDALRSGSITFSPASGSAIQVAIAPKLAVKSQEDFISMANVSLPDLNAAADYKVPFVLENNLYLVANASDPYAKFDNSVIPVAEKAFNFDGGGKTIYLNSEINTVANDKPAAIIGEMKGRADFKNFILNVNQPISGTRYVSTIIANAASGASLHNIKININSSLSLYKSNASASSYVGGLVGIGCFDINNVVVKTGSGAVVQAHVADDRVSSYGYSEKYYVGGLVAAVNCSATISAVKSNNLVDVTLGSFASDNSKGNSLEVNMHIIGGFVAYVGSASTLNMNNNLVRLSISRGNTLSTDFNVSSAAGFFGDCARPTEVTNNLVYADFSNLGKVQYVAGLFDSLDYIGVANNIANNMLFIADGFNTGNVTEKFGAAIQYMGSEASGVANITNLFVSSPVTDNEYTNNTKLASFVHFANRDINFKNLILDNKTDTAMFKTGHQQANLQGKVDAANVFDLADAKTNGLSTLFSDGNTSWEEGGADYPQLKVPTDFSGSVTKAEIEEAWNSTNDLIQKGLADRANQ